MRDVCDLRFVPLEEVGEETDLVSTFVEGVLGPSRFPQNPINSGVVIDSTIVVHIAKIPPPKVVVIHGVLVPINVTLRLMQPSRTRCF